MIETKGIEKKYQDKRVLTDLSLKLPENQLIAFIGPNGAGKSTLLSIISRMLEQTTGEVYFKDQEIRQWHSKELAKNLAFLQQSNGFTVDMTVEELVAFGRFPYNRGRTTSEDEAIIAESLALLSLESFRKRSIHALSGGQLQRVYLAMILAQDTEYILLDEPLNNLDLKHANQLMHLLEKLVKDHGKTVIIVLHDINFAARYADHIVAMKEGHLFKTGNVAEVIQEPVLKELYDLEVKIVEVDGQRFCYYFN
jgi:iron complex transport system ATP-binding protein